MIEEEKQKVWKERKLGGWLYNANEFLAAANLCSANWLNIAEMTNVAFACESYIKAIEEHEKRKASTGHNLEKLFAKLTEKTKKQVYELWRTTFQPNNEDHPFFQKMFNDNIGACAEGFERFRYTNEWSGSVISSESSLRAKLTDKEKREQEKTGKLIQTPFEKYSQPSATRPFGSTQVYGGFINQFAKCLKTVAENLIGRTYNS